MIQRRYASLFPRLALVSAFALMAPLAAVAAPDATPAASADAAKPNADPTPSQDVPPAAETARGAHGPAQTPMEAMRQDRDAFFSASLAALHAGLQLDASQDSLWPPVETAIRNLAKTEWQPGDRRAARDVRPDNARDLLRLRGERLVRRGEAVKGLADAAQPLVSGLTEQQRRRLPILLEGLHSPRIMMMAFAVAPKSREGFGRHGRDDGEMAGSQMRHDHRSADDDDHDDDGRGRGHGFEAGHGDHDVDRDAAAGHRSGRHESDNDD